MPALPTTDRQLFTPKELESRVSTQTYVKLNDDNKSGAADPVVVQQIIKDASAVVWSYMPGFPLADGDEVPDYLKKLALDLGQAFTYKRFPQTSLGQAGMMIEAAAKADLKALSTGATAIPPAGGGGGSGSSSGTGASNDQGHGVVRSRHRVGHSDGW